MTPIELVEWMAYFEMLKEEQKKQSKK